MFEIARLCLCVGRFSQCIVVLDKLTSIRVQQMTADDALSVLRCVFIICALLVGLRLGSSRYAGRSVAVVALTAFIACNEWLSMPHWPLSTCEPRMLTKWF